MAEIRLHRRWWDPQSPAGTGHASEVRGQSSAWRLLAPAAFVLAGALFATSAVTSGGTDIRAGRYDDLASLATAEAKDLEALRDQAAELTERVDLLSAHLEKGGVEKAQAQVQGLSGPAGLLPVAGAGVTITLEDAPEQIRDTTDVDVKDLIVHQQDIQAVVNALWGGGAEAMTIQGQRIISTTGIKCVGNTVVLHDVPYAPPYVISAIGPIDQMLDSVASDPYIDLYLQFVDEYSLGWDLEVDSSLKLPGYTGSTELDYARAPPQSKVAD